MGDKGLTERVGRMWFDGERCLTVGVGWLVRYRLQITSSRTGVHYRPSGV